LGAPETDVPVTAFAHFQEDISRARAILDHANPLPAGSDAEKLLRSDLLRSSWMFAIGALDAYFCDAYTDVVAATLASKCRQPTVNLPDFVEEIMLPARAVLAEYKNENWRWRMAARKMMERENVLSLKTVQELFNKFFRDDRRLFRPLVLDTWITHPDATPRLFGVRGTAFSTLSDPDKNAARTAAREQMEGRFRDLIQRRHDCIHNCDRPRVAPQPLSTASTVLKVIQDVEFFVRRCNEHINTEFTLFLNRIGCTAATLADAGY
jgi:hypothetical protein